MDEIATKLATYISKEILKQPNREMTPEEKLISSGLVDSFSLIDIGLFIEDNFGVHIDNTELNADTFDNLGQLSALIRSRQ